MTGKKVQFLKVYANLPLSAREDIIVVIDGEPMTWKVAKLEIEQDTPKGKEIIEILTKLKILP